MKLKSVVTSVKSLASKLEDTKHQAKSLDDIIRALKKTISDIEAASVQETERDLSSVTQVDEVKEVKSGNELSQEATDSTDTEVEKPTATATTEGKIIFPPGPTDTKSTDCGISTKPAATGINPVCADQEMIATCSIGDDTFAAESLAQPATSVVENLSSNNMISTTLSDMDLEVPSISTAEQLSSNIGRVPTADLQGSEETHSCDLPVVLASQSDVKMPSKDSGQLDQDVVVQDVTMEH